MTTIGHFEQALGRRALWAPRQVADLDAEGSGQTNTKCRRLRIYPHALRARQRLLQPGQEGAALRLFPAPIETASDATAPGSMVFACLSSDIIAHEMSHALLDGLHRRFQEASNPDVPAFHEAFADIVALFQHFTIPELVRFEIARGARQAFAPRPCSADLPSNSARAPASAVRCATISARRCRS